ncbi:DNA polymerase III subunit gamma/tau [Arsenicitalea aurantiaca]|uniref:DNA polymerase III subunit gamma/tau n=1 Tax=Arsenicitalea aurantiaca TaxID=1783274 RepID=A0A433X263_9HYPH|nr:DNA polymerase III subunit gamma/tau [Arsenicitalea aurantiaca]RUT28206.1 DNA polymerase III subunit gamma/tau [Arsenicitalea aurantiaca]
MATSDTAHSPYLVLARKYRPLSFSGLIGQDAMVQTLSNAFKSGRIHHAFILTGVRGVGKTTTARILARAFNYEDEEGRRPTLDLSEEGVHCRAIIEGRHVDVVEMDAASNTGIGDIREIIDSVKYGPVSAPYKVYIIDEVHMLSTAAFNGLLKTLEEPPPYVKFIFATTEIRKVPVTILSRCMRFDLRRVTPEVMTAHLIDLLEREAIPYEPEALAMIVRAGEGSVRDNQSLLDQAISHGDGRVTAETVKAMLGLADRAMTIDLFETLMQGDIATALGQLGGLYDAGADPQTILSDLATLTHLVTRIKLVPSAAEDASLTPDERTRGADLAGRLSMRALTRAWQILFKGYEEVSRAGNAMQAAEMVLIRLTHALDLPSPDEIIAKFANQPAPSGQSGPSMRPGGGGGGAQALRIETRTAEPLPTPAPSPAPLAGPQSYQELIALAGAKRDLIVKHALESALRPISLTDGRLEVGLVEGADPGIVQTLSARLKLWTGRSWLVTVSNKPEAAAPTIREMRAAREAASTAEAHEDPLVQAILSTFPGARLVNVNVRDDALPAQMPSAPELEEDDE